MNRPAKGSAHEFFDFGWRPRHAFAVAATALFVPGVTRAQQDYPTDAVTLLIAQKAKCSAIDGRTTQRSAALSHSDAGRRSTNPSARCLIPRFDGAILSQEWKEAGVEVLLTETRQVKAALSAIPIKTDRGDARGIAPFLRMGWFRPVHCKSVSAQEVSALLIARKQLQKRMLDIELGLRGVLRGLELRVVKISKGRFAERVQEFASGNPMLERVTVDLPGKSGERQLRNQEVFYVPRKTTDAGVQARSGAAGVNQRPNKARDRG